MINWQILLAFQPFYFIWNIQTQVFVQVVVSFCRIGKCKLKKITNFGVYVIKINILTISSASFSLTFNTTSLSSLVLSILVEFQKIWIERWLKILKPRGKSRPWLASEATNWNEIIVWAQIDKLFGEIQANETVFWIPGQLVLLSNSIYLLRDTTTQKDNWGWVSGYSPLHSHQSQLDPATMNRTSLRRPTPHNQRFHWPTNSWRDAFRVDTSNFLWQQNEEVRQFWNLSSFCLIENSIICTLVRWFWFETRSFWIFVWEASLALTF